MLFIPSPKYLRELRKAAGLSQAELARRAGVSQSLIARIESGDVNPRVSTLQRILKALEEYVEEELKAEDIMTSPVITVKTSDPISKVADIMWENAISQV
ncbi:MAG: transcriptional regulator, partial [Thermoprotei archaeon]